MEDNKNQIVNSRLAFIELLLQFKGWLSRSDLMAKFGLQEAAATRDLRLYREMADKNLSLNHRTRKYEINKNEFEPKFKTNIKNILSSMSDESFSKDVGFDGVGIESIPRLSYPNESVIFEISKAIINKQVLSVEYKSVEKGSSKKEIAPHSMFDNGLKVYARCFDFEKERHISLAIDRFVSLAESSVEYTEECSKSKDHEWNEIVELHLAAHGENVGHIETIEHELNMIDGCVKIKTRAALAQFWLSAWNVDCSDGHTIKDGKYQLKLNNPDILNSIKSKKIIPGVK